MLKRLGKQSRSAAQEAAQRQAALNEKNSADKFTRVIRRTQSRVLRRDSSQSDVHECETSVRRHGTAPGVLEARERGNSMAPPDV